MSINVKYRIEFIGGDFFVQAAWNCGASGRPSVSTIEKYVVQMVKSASIGGVNEHLSKSLGHLCNPPTSAQIIEQSTGKIKASWKCPAFFTIDD